MINFQDPIRKKHSLFRTFIWGNVVGYNFCWCWSELFFLQTVNDFQKHWKKWICFSKYSENSSLKLLELGDPKKVSTGWKDLAIASNANQFPSNFQKYRVCLLKSEYRQGLKFVSVTVLLCFYWHKFRYNHLFLLCINVFFSNWFLKKYRICQNQRPPKTGIFSKGGVHKTDGFWWVWIFQRGDYTKPMGFDGWFFKGGTTQNRWSLMGLDFLKGEYTQPMGFDGFWNFFCCLWKLSTQGVYFGKIRYSTDL